MILATVLGIALDFANVVRSVHFLTVASSMVYSRRFLSWALLVASDQKIMNNQTSSMLSRIVVGATAGNVRRAWDVYLLNTITGK
jgi:hypothetical protein